MKKLLFVLAVVAILTFGVIGTLAAQGNEPPRPDAPQIQLSTTFTYQGVLRRSSGLVTAVCDMAFRLHRLPLGNLVIGEPITTTVPITNGQFTVGLDFGPGAFNGEERWLDISVRCAPETSFTALTPFQRIAPVPYALALPGLYTLRNATSTNLVGGFYGNTISDTVVGGVIGGGGLAGHPNRVTDNYSTVAGGYENWALNSFATIGGGASNRASGYKSTVPGGQSANATHEGEFAYANGAFAEIGDAQTSMYVLKATTDFITETTALMRNGGETGITLAPGRTMVFDILIVASSPAAIYDEGGSAFAGFRVQGVVQTTTGITLTHFAAQPTITPLGANSGTLSVAAIANNTAHRLDIRVTGSGGPIRWVATVRTTEVSH